MNSPEEWACELKEHLASAQSAANALLARGYEVEIKVVDVAPSNPSPREIRLNCTVAKKVYI